jgi:hypothetical protein
MTSGTRGKTKTANPSGRRSQSSGGDFIQRVSSPHIIGKLSFPIKGTLALHCQVARLVFESFLMLVRIVSGSRPSAINLCVIAHRPTCRSAVHLPCSCASGLHCFMVAVLQGCNWASARRHCGRAKRRDSFSRPTPPLPPYKARRQRRAPL